MNKEKTRQFLKVETKRELANCLGVEYRLLIYYLHKLDDERKYSNFEIRKRSGKLRYITAPISKLKRIQRNLARILLDIYPSKNCVNGFVLEKNIKTNAAFHSKKKIIVNIDLKDFFPSINFGRVRGIFCSYPFNFNTTIATALAQISCYKGFLPQGSPTSPIISNFICRRLDNSLMELSNIGRFTYSRYADDISFSTNKLPLPQEIGVIESNKLILSSLLVNRIQSNGFNINDDKIRFATNENRQEVTGLVVNKFVNVKRNYVRHIRAMLHAIEKYGLESAAKDHFDKYNYKNKIVLNTEISFINELVGKIGYVGYIKGKNNTVYQSLYRRIKTIYPEARLSIAFREVDTSELPLIHGEGKTDWKHFKAALNYFKENGDYLDLEVNFNEVDDDYIYGESNLVKFCQSIANLSKSYPLKNKLICIFDGDIGESRKRNICKDGEHFKYWGNKVYSVLLPKPSYRNPNEACVELYYKDKDIMRKDKNKRRLFLSSEFNKSTGKHLTEELIYKNINHLNSPFIRIIDDDVFDENNKNVALSKNNFASYVLNKETEFTNVNFESFRLIFDIVRRILRSNP